MIRPLIKEDFHPIQTLMSLYEDATLFNQSRLFFQKDIFFHYVNEQTDASQEVYFSIVDASTNDFIGLIGLIHHRYDDEAELVIVIKPSYQGKGYADHAMTLIIAFAFTNRNLETIHIVTEKANKKAIELFKRLHINQLSLCDADHECYVIKKEDFIKNMKK